MHKVIPDLNVKKIHIFAQKHRNKIGFAIAGSEAPIIAGLKDLLEGKLGIPTIAPSQRYALEASKANQRLLLEECFPDVNPRFKIFHIETRSDTAKVLRAAQRWIHELGGVHSIVIKPDKPGFGKGVGVGGEHFTEMKEALHHFKNLLGERLQETVIIEEKIEGEESSFQAWCDGKTLSVMPETRDYKRAFDGDTGPNTGGMGSYRNVDEWLPFMNPSDRANEIKVAQTLLNHLKNRGRNPNLLGVPFYIAFIHTSSTPKILEINSRPGDPEIMNILPTMDTDLVDVCFDMINGSLNQVRYLKKASVVTYAVPLTYGSYREKYSGDNKVRLEEAYRVSSQRKGHLLVYPGSMEQRGTSMYALKSRVVALIGIGDSIAEAREWSLQGIKCIDGPLWNRWDIASDQHINDSIIHLNNLRKGSVC